jgi:hypothetical protein
VLKENEILYLAGSGGGVNWYRNLVADPNVTVRVKSLRLRGKVVGASKGKELVGETLELFREKYGTGERAAVRIRLIESI